jgi:serine/threonine-protein kinase
MPDTGRILGGRYQLLELVGQGGMATIYRARDDQLGRDVAVKVLRPEYGSDTAFVLRFKREAQAAAQLSHPNVVAVYDTGSDQIGPYIVMELVTGGDLAGVLRERGPLPGPAAARIAQQIADALEAAHAKGIVHRDIKPSNVLLSSGGRVKVADFGIAQAFTEVQLTLTQPGMTMGSVHYFSPEQARGEVVTGASDVYSAGLVLFEMLTGMRPFGGDSAAAVAMARLTGQVPSPAMVRPDVPPALDAIVRWTLAPDPRARPTATELSMALGRYLADPMGTSAYAASSPPPPPVLATPRYAIAPPAPPPPPATGAAPRGGGSVGLLAALGGLFLLVLGGVLIFLIIGWGAAGPSPSPSPTPSIVPTPTPVPTAFAVPRFEGMLIDDARRLAGRYQLRLKVTTRESSAVDPDTVLSQNPAFGEAVMPGSTVRVVVAVPVATIDIPDLRLRTEEDAIAALLEAGLRNGTRFDVFNPNVPVGRVVRTDPRAGTPVPPDTVVDYAISKGPRPTPTEGPPTPSPTPSPERVIVGLYQCQDLATTRQQIEDAGLRVGSVSADQPDFDDSWLVIAQQPLAGREVAKGRRIDLLLVDPSSPCP